MCDLFHDVLLSLTVSWNLNLKQWMVVSIWGYLVGTILIQRQVGAEEQMVKNGDVQEMLLLITSTVKDICIEVVPVQESLWNFTPITIKSKGLVVILILFLCLILLWLSLIQLQENMDLHHIFLLPPLFILIYNLPFLCIIAALNLQISNQGEFISVFCYICLELHVLNHIESVEIRLPLWFCWKLEASKYSFC